MQTDKAKLIGVKIDVFPFLYLINRCHDCDIDLRVFRFDCFQQRILT